jgi:hypothetical protein
MPVEVVDITVVPKTIRNRTSPVKSSVEWQETLRVLRELKAKQAVKIEFSPATLKLAKNVPFTFMRLLQRYLKNKGLTDLTVFLRGNDSRGNNKRDLCSAARILTILQTLLVETDCIGKLRTLLRHLPSGVLLFASNKRC